MPYITITEHEDTTLSSFDVTDNTVLIPLLYRVGDNESVKSAELYTDAKKFKKDFPLSDTGSNIRRVVKYSDTEFDRSYTMAYELLLQGLSVVIKPIEWKIRESSEGEEHVNEEDCFKAIETAIQDNKAFEEFKNKNVYNIKFITSGGYHNMYLKAEETSEGTTWSHETNLYDELTAIAETRGDAVALLELKNVIDSTDAILNQARNMTAMTDKFKYAAMFTPWCSFYTTASTERIVQMPACFAYLMAYANSVKTNANWFAASGVLRGVVPNMISPKFDIWESTMNILQGGSSEVPVCINPIYNAGTYGYRIWGNRVLTGISYIESLKYQDFLNVRVLLCDIKKQIYHSAMRLTFEPNDDIVWINFKTLVNSLLDRMKSGRGISWYNWSKEKSDVKALIKAKLTIKPIEAIEAFEVDINLSDEETVVSESSI